MLEENQVCRICGIEKPLTEYYINRNMANGHQSACKECVRERRKKHYKENKDEISEYNKHYYKKNAEEVREARMKRYYGKK